MQFDDLINHQLDIIAMIIPDINNPKNSKAKCRF